ncbi:MAG TPA: ABC transporter ATP-binding protein [Gemmatimonadaceae bacterium]|nr:ABC transporter ATP-binding protein [Gemmatimonadaceae bacterium]
MKSDSRGISHLVLRLWEKLPPRRKRQFGLLGALMLVSAFAEVLSLGAVIPFLSVLVAPERLFAYESVRRMAEMFGVRSPSELVLPVTIAFATAALVAGAIRMLLLRLSTRLVFASGADLSSEVYRRTLYQPYEVHLSRNTSSVISSITHEVNVAAGVLMSLQILGAAAILLIAIMATLIAINPAIAFTATVGFGGSYLAITRFSRRRLRENSEKIAAEQVQVIKALQEGLGGIRDVLLDGSQEIYLSTYRKADSPVRLAQAENMYIGQSPRYAMETLGMVIIAALAFALMRKPGGAADAIPTLGILAFGAQRLLPALQQIYNSWSNIAGSEASLRNVLAMLDQAVKPELLLPRPGPLEFTDAVRLERVRFRYGSSSPWVLDGLSLTIPKGARVGFVGTTGSGKTTTLDLIMGLLSPTEGRVSVDNVSLSESNMRAWQRTIAHVPQTVYLSDATLAENIAFGISPDAIDHARLKRAARNAQIADFIEGRPDGYLSRVGERGIHLSGGQRQRIGIARALYKETDVMILDEATSALDNATEQAVVDSLKDLDVELTILIVAHRLSTVRGCDFIVQLENGIVAGQGTYDELLSSSSSFRRIAAASH